MVYKERRSIAWRRATVAGVALSLVAATSAITAQPIYKWPAEIRKRNYVRLSTEPCDECMTMDEFYAHNPLGFVLFYERNLMHGHGYKDAIIKGWMDVCQDLRYSRISCAMVDMVHANDREYAKRYIDPKTAPAHIIVRAGQPVMAMQQQVEPLLKKPGDKATLLNHIGELLQEEGTMPGLSLSTQVDHKDAFNRLLQKHHLVVVSFSGEERRLSEAFRSGVQEAVLEHGLPTQVTSTDKPDETTSRKGKGGKKDDAYRSHKAKEKTRIAFVAANGASLLRHHDVQQGSIVAFIDGKLQPGEIKIKADARPGDTAVVEAVKQIASQQATVFAAGASAPRSNEL